jgi:hypothetical protein
VLEVIYSVNDTFREHMLEELRRESDVSLTNASLSRELAMADNESFLMNNEAFASILDKEDMHNRTMRKSLFIT